MLSEISHTEKDRYVWSHLDVESKKIITKHKQKVAKEEQVCVCGGGEYKNKDNFLKDCTENQF